MDENALLLHSAENTGLSQNQQNALEKLEEFVKRNSDGLFCGSIRLVLNARDVRNEEQWICTASLYTLAEQRWTEKRTVPYNDSQLGPANSVGDIWEDYPFDSPKTTILNPPELSIKKDLNQTRQQVECPRCENGCETQCSHCKNRRSVITWTQLNVKWSNICSKLTYPTHNQGVYPESIVDTRAGKIKCLDFDDVWSSERKTLDSILGKCSYLPEGFRNELNRTFIIHQRADKILRLKCLIERLRIEKIEYHLDGSPNEIFTFYVVGEERNIHLTTSSYPTSTRQCLTACSVL